MVRVVYSTAFSVRVVRDAELGDGALEVGVEGSDEHGDGKGDEEYKAGEIGGVPFGGYVGMLVRVANSLRSIMVYAC